MIKLNLDGVEMTQDSLSLEPGQYLCEIIRVEDVQEKEYLKIGFDIIDGKFKNIMSRIHSSKGRWPASGIMYKSYKQKALGYFKRFIVAVEKSNADYIFDFDEQKLLHKKFVGNFGIEEWINDSGEVVESVKLEEACSVESWKQGKIQTPAPKRIKQEDLQPVKEETDPVKKELNSLQKEIDDLPF